MPNWSWSNVTVPNANAITKEQLLERFTEERTEAGVQHPYVTAEKTSGRGEVQLPHIDLTNTRIGEDKKKGIIMTSESPFSNSHVFMVSKDEDPTKLQNLLGILSKAGFNDPYNESCGPKGLNKIKDEMDKFMGVGKGMANPLDWYDYNIQELGVKWGFELENLEVNEESVTFKIETAWTAPIPFFLELARFMGAPVFAKSTYEGEGEYIQPDDMEDKEFEKLIESGDHDIDWEYTKFRVRYDPVSDAAKEMEKKDV